MLASTGLFGPSFFDLLLILQLFQLGMLLLSFLQAPSYTRCAFLVLVPINLAMDLQQGFVLELPALVTLLLAVSMGDRRL